MTEPAPIPRRRRNPRRAYDQDGREIEPPTFGSLRAEGETTAEIHCEAMGCGRVGIISTDGLPADLPFPDVALRCRCSQCGSKQVRATKDMEAHYRRMQAGGFDCNPFGKGA